MITILIILIILLVICFCFSDVEYFKSQKIDATCSPYDRETCIRSKDCVWQGCIPTVTSKPTYCAMLIKPEECVHDEYCEWKGCLPIATTPTPEQ